jgi:hypothetical protein
MPSNVALGKLLPFISGTYTRSEAPSVFDPLILQSRCRIQVAIDGQQSHPTIEAEYFTLWFS